MATIDPAQQRAKSSVALSASLSSRSRNPMRDVVTNAIPPPRGVGVMCELRSLGISIFEKRCGYGLEYWLVEILSLLIGSGLLYLIWKLNDLSHCSTVVNDRVKK